MHIQNPSRLLVPMITPGESTENNVSDIRSRTNIMKEGISYSIIFFSNGNNAAKAGCLPKLCLWIKHKLTEGQLPTNQKL